MTRNSLDKTFDNLLNIVINVGGLLNLRVCGQEENE